MSTIGIINSFESLASGYGPGVRFLVVMQDSSTQEEGKPYSPQAVITKAVRFKEYWGKDGGIAVIGGEPLMQMDFLLELFTEAKKRGISTSLVTSGLPFIHEGSFLKRFYALIKETDFLIVDFMHIDEEKHFKLTGHNNRGVKVMLEYLSFIDESVWIRYPLIEGYNDEEGDLEAMAIYLSSLSNIEKIEVIPYPSSEPNKYEELGIEHRLKDVPSPSKEEIEKAQKILSKALRTN